MPYLNDIQTLNMVVEMCVILNEISQSVYCQGIMTSSSLVQLWNEIIKKAEPKSELWLP